MTAPRRQHGVDAQVMAQYHTDRRASQERSCESKNRYTDEHVARAVGIHQMARHGWQLYFYPCPHCRGCHLTRRERAAFYAVDYYTRGE